MAGEAIWPR